MRNWLTEAAILLEMFDRLKMVLKNTILSVVRQFMISNLFLGGQCRKYFASKLYEIMFLITKPIQL
jgi:hypothetical protein